MLPDPKTLDPLDIINTTFILDRTDIYLRLRKISQLHTGAKQENGAKSFYVGREYNINSNNLGKLEQQGNKTAFPKYFYSERLHNNRKKPKKVVKDFPLVFMTPGERSFIDSLRKRSIYEFDLIVFDLEGTDRNSAKGNETALREKEDIWRDTERILLEVLEAYQDSSLTAVYNVCLAGEYLGYPEDVGTWTPEQEQAAEDLIKRMMISKNFNCSISASLMPFEHKHNNNLIGVHTVVSTEIFTGCIDGSFVNTLCS